MRRRNTRSGFTVVEVVISATIAAAILGFGITLAGSAQRDSTAVYAQSLVSDRVANAVEEVARDLQTSGVAGEDRNGNGELDSDEDTNNSGVLESDWSLEDGGTASSISFNRIEKRWVWTTAVTYSVSDGVLLRTQDGASREICRGVTAFSVSRNGTTVDVSITSEAKDGQGQVWSRTATRRVYVRN